jgi:hypothetical protein
MLLYIEIHFDITINARFLHFKGKFKDTFSSVNFVKYIFIFKHIQAIGAAATPVLLCQPRVIVKMIVEKQMECRL